jgi:hypothetical protein
MHHESRAEIRQLKECVVAKDIGKQTMLSSKSHDGPDAHKCKELNENVDCRLHHGWVEVEIPRNPDFYYTLKGCKILDYRCDVECN